MFSAMKWPLKKTVALRKIPSNSTEMHRPASLPAAELSPVQPTLVSGYSRPKALHHAPPAAVVVDEGKVNRPVVRQIDLAPRRIVEARRSRPPTCLPWRRCPSRSACRSEVLDWIVGIAQAKRQPKSSNSRSRSVFGWFGSDGSRQAARRLERSRSRDPRAQPVDPCPSSLRRCRQASLHQIASCPLTMLISSKRCRTLGCIVRILRVSSTLHRGDVLAG